MGRSAWLDRRIQSEYLPLIRGLRDTKSDRALLERFTQHIREQWATEHGKPDLMQQQRLMDMTRRAIKDEFGEDHWSLQIVKLSKQEYTRINDQRQGNVAQRNEQVQVLHDPDAIVATAVKLLEHPDWAVVAAGLAVLTGRRSAELLSTAEFVIQTQWSVQFSGAVKRRGETGLSFEIPTLTTSKRVVDAIQKIRRELPDAVHLPADQVNAKYGDRVAKACDQYFQKLVPCRAGKDSLYTHLFRAVYATIATFWYCPPSVHETEFKAAIQGHFQILDETNPELRRSLVASRHYADYEIADEIIAQYHGKRKGIKLGLAGVQPIAMFKTVSLQEVKASLEALPARRKVGQIRVFLDSRDRWNAVLSAIAPDGNQQEQMDHLLAWIEQQLDVEEREEFEIEPEVEIEPEIEAIAPEDVSEPEPIPEVVDPLRQDIRSLVSAIQQLVQIQAQPVIPQPVRPAIVPPTRPQPVISDTPRKKSSTRDSQALIDAWIQRIMDYNNETDRTYDQKWAITLSLLKSLGCSQSRLEKVIPLRTDIVEHHQAHGIDPEKHNLKHRGKTKIQDIIRLDREPAFFEA